jgi:hypothetical protein
MRTSNLNFELLKNQHDSCSILPLEGTEQQFASLLGLFVAALSTWDALCHRFLTEYIFTMSQCCSHNQLVCVSRGRHQYSFHSGNELRLFIMSTSRIMPISLLSPPPITVTFDHFAFCRSTSVSLSFPISRYILLATRTEENLGNPYLG